MTEPQLLPKLYLSPGELIIAEIPLIITTVLGSCISVVLFSPRLKIGAICHATMPSGEEERPGKFADQSILYLLEEFQLRGIKRRETLVKLFGGSDMFTLKHPENQSNTIGAQNVRSAIATLGRAGYEPMVNDVGGSQGRKLVFHSNTGNVFRKWVKKEMLDY